MTLNVKISFSSLSLIRFVYLSKASPFDHDFVRYHNISVCTMILTSYLEDQGHFLFLLVIYVFEHEKIKLLLLEVCTTRC